MIKKAIALLPMLIAAAGCQVFQSAEPLAQELTAVDFMKKYDFNHDGRVSMDEYDGGLKAFVEMDSNRDTVISSSEVPVPKSKAGHS